MMGGLIRFGLAGLLSLAAALCVLADEPARKAAPSQAAPLSPEESRAASRAALEELGGLIGEWRGVARPRRNSTAGAWIEKGEWVWEIKKDHVGLRYVVKDGKQVTTGLLTFDPATKEYALEATLEDKTQRRYTGTFADNRLTLTSKFDGEGKLHQFDLKQLSDKRIVLLYQSRLQAQQQFALVAEVGYTREGTKLAEEGAGGPECIVSGGKGTMSVVYKGKTYWFCCTGCRDAFNDDPEGIIAEAAQRAAKKKKP